MANKKLLTIAGLLASVGTAGVLGLSSVSAETSDDSGNNPMSGLVSKIAEKFNLKEEEVQAVFEEHRDEMHEEHQAKIEERLTQAVEDGKITEDQKSKILAKLDELKQEHDEKREEFQNMTDEERREAMETRRDELEEWAEANNIPEKYLRLRIGGPGHGLRHSF